MHSFLTFKSGKFYFNEAYDTAQVDNLLVRAVVLNETISDLPILPELASQIEPEIMYSSIAGTAAIEGNPISGEDVERIAKGEELEKYTKKDQQEIRNLISAYQVLADIKPCEDPFFLTEELICDLHQIITQDVPDEHNIPGKYRNGQVHVGDSAHGGVYTPPKILEDVQNLMREYVGWINSEKAVQLNPFIRASLAHYYFCIIHPFWDGNGRTGRLLEAILLQAGNVKFIPREMSNYYYRNVDEYYNAFSKSIKLEKDATPFIRFCLVGAVESITSIKERIIYFIRKFALRDYYRHERQQKNLTVRQYELLGLLLDNPVSFTLKDMYERQPYSLLYGKATTQTARRDLKKLTSMNLLTAGGGNTYSLNMRVLG